MHFVIRRAVALPFIAILITSCSGDAGDPDILTAEYLEDPWCYVQYEAAGSVEEERITYQFETDGTLKYQNDSGGPIDQSGSYELNREGLKILPAFSAFPPMRAISISDNRLTLLSRDAELLWTRGACSE